MSHDSMEATGAGILCALPPSTALRISSGQVITSVSSAVKEMLENALDAGADAVEVRLEEFGLDKIVVQDNGGGIRREELPLAAARHCTSKIKDLEDLSRLSSYGFRGEALSSCCEMGQVEVASRAEGEDVGARVSFDQQGKVSCPVRSAPMNRGTTVTLAGIFSRLPVRRKVAERTAKKKEELKKVERICMAFAIIRPKLRLSLVHRGCVILKKPPAPPPGDLRASACECLPLDVASNLVLMKATADGDDGPLEAEMLVPRRGAIAAAEMTRSNPDRTFVFVNGRPVNDKPVTSLLKRVTSEAAASSSTRHPIAVVSIRVPASSLDANLEPNKHSVVFGGSGILLEAMEARLRKYYALDGGEGEEEEDTMEDSALIDKEVIGKDDDEKTMDETRSSDEENNLDETAEDNGEVPIRDYFQKKKGGSGKAKQVLVEKNCDDSASLQSEKNDVERDPEEKYENVEEEMFSPWEVSEGGEGGSGTSVSSDENSKEVAPSSSQSLRQLDLSDWSRGTALGASVEPAKILSGPPIPPAEKRPRREIRAKEDERIDDFLVRMDRRRKEVGDRTLMTAAKGSQGTPRISRRARIKITRRVAEVNFSMDRVKEILLGNERPEKPSLEDGKGVVGRLKENPYWVCRLGKSLTLLSHHRAEEASLLGRLLDSHKLPSERLKEPKEIILEEAESRVVKSMRRDTNGTLSDNRLDMNGFKILTGEDHKRAQIVSACPAVTPVARAEFRHILQAIAEDEKVTVSVSRPPKVRAHLLGEAVRMVRQRPPGVDKERAEEILSRLDTDSLCPHEKPVLTEFHKL